MIKKRVLQSSYQGSMAVSSFDHNAISFIPWESMQACHSYESIFTAIKGCTYYRPISARVEIYDVTAHAEVPIDATHTVPQELRNLRLRSLRQDELWLCPRQSVFDTEA